MDLKYFKKCVTHKIQHILVITKIQCKFVLQKTATIIADFLIPHYVVTGGHHGSKTLHQHYTRK